MNRSTERSPWPALWALVLGFFMILVDTTIVSVANPSIMRGLDTTMTATLWATSAYLLAYAVPLLITGRLGDRFGPRRVYLIGLSLFTLSSLACGLSTGIEMLVTARVFQGFGASLMTPQTMAVITRIFKPRERGQAMAIWGVTAGAATLVGPILGGFLVDGLGWEWIFFVNVPVGVIGFLLALRFVPRLETSSHRFDVPGVLLSAVGMFLVVFGIQEGESYDWGPIWGPITVWQMIVAGVVILVVFVWWQGKQRGEPLVPLSLFRDRNFSVGSGTMVAAGFAVASMGLPLMFYMQLVLGLTPTESALMMSPMAVLSIALARPAGLMIDKGDPRLLPVIGMVFFAAGLGLYFWLATPDVAWGLLLIPSTVLGLGNALMWGPLAAITTFGLKPELAGAGSGVYNTSRQVGSVLGTAAMTALMAARLTAQFGDAAGAAGGIGGDSGAGALPEPLRAGYAAAMAESMLLPLAVVLIGAVIAIFFQKRPPVTRTVPVVVPGE